MSAPRQATAFAPATVANVAVGFDLLGFAIGGFGDLVTVRRIEEPTVRIASVTGLSETLPLEAARNTAGVVLIGLRERLGLASGFEVEVRKGIPLGSGMGGSAASAVGALVAANALLDHPLARTDLFRLSLLGETLAGGAPHGDNVGPCLFGGLLLTRRVEPPDLVPLPVLPELRAVLVHPRICVNTREARAILRPDVSLRAFIDQSANLAGFTAACFTRDYGLLGRSLEDLVIEPQRAHLIPGFAEAKAAALSAGALGFTISGSGPSVFALTREDEDAERVRQAIGAVFARHSLECDEWVGPISLEGASVVESQS